MDCLEFVYGLSNGDNFISIRPFLEFINVHIAYSNAIECIYISEFQRMSSSRANI